MKTFLKLLVAVFALGFATANAAFTPEQKAAAIKAVTDAVATGDEAKVKAAVSAQVFAFPELAGDIVSAALKVPGITTAIRNVVVSTAAFTAPYELGSINSAITNSSGLTGTDLSGLITLATNSSGDGMRTLDSNKRTVPPNTPAKKAS